MPPDSKNIFLSEIEDKKHTGHGNHPVDGRHRRIPYVRLNSGSLIGCQLLLISQLPFLLTAEYTIRDGILCPVQSYLTQNTGLHFVSGTGTLYHSFHFLRYGIRNRRKDHAQQCQTPVII